MACPNNTKSHAQIQLRSLTARLAQEASPSNNANSLAQLQVYYVPARLAKHVSLSNNAKRLAYTRVRHLAARFHGNQSIILQRWQVSICVPHWCDSHAVERSYFSPLQRMKERVGGEPYAPPMLPTGLFLNCRGYSMALVAFDTTNVLLLCRLSSSPFATLGLLAVEVLNMALSCSRRLVRT